MKNKNLFSIIALFLILSCQETKKENADMSITQKPGKAGNTSDNFFENKYADSINTYFHSEEYSYSSESFESSSYYQENENVSILSENYNQHDIKILSSKENKIKIIEKSIQPIRIAHQINTSTSDYHPAVSPDGKMLYFTGMDRTGYFDNKIDFTKTRNAGGEDIFLSLQNNGIWTDAKSVVSVNTNGHEAVTQVLNNGNLMLSGNYPENMGPDENSNGSNTSDLFMAYKNKNYQLFHFDEPVNSIYTELDGHMSNDQSYILFCSDRPGKKGKYHKKGWQWNGSYWGNTDIYVSQRDGDSWTAPVALGNGINTDFAERTPWLSFDGLTLFVSSNGYNPYKKDMDIYFFTRKNKNDWEHWDGPYEVKGLNGPTDDWGYQEDKLGNGFFARAVKLGYTPTKKAKDGTGFVFETNFRSGYEIHGLQSGSFQKDEQTDIYTVNKNNVAITLPDALFDVDSYKLKPAFKAMKDEIVDAIKINNPKIIRIIGHTDSDGTVEHNNKLSLQRAESVRDFLSDELYGIDIKCEGKGSGKPLMPNTTSENKQKNRRVEILFNN